jgi:hypothetical protein
LLSAIFRPRPYPAFVLLAIICAFIGFNLMRISRIAGYIVIAVGVALLISFIRGLMIDLSINRAGILTTARVTTIERKSGTYTFADQSGAPHENSIEIWDDEEASRWKVGDSGNVRYHPDFPEEHRWLD